MKIFITGISGGLGIKLAEEFIGDGDTVWGVGRHDLNTLSKRLSTNKEFYYMRCDVTNNGDINKVYREMLNKNIIPDVIIFCAGAAIDDIVNDEFVMDNVVKNFNLNLYGVLKWIELFMPHFMTRKSGVFAAISSLSIYRENHKKRIGYSASKMALNKAFENLHQEYFNTGIKFVSINMGRMKEDKEFIGTTYVKAAAVVAKYLKSRKIPRVINMPFIQYILTKILQFMPESLFCKYIRK